MDLDGFFSQVYLVFFKADDDGTFQLSPKHTVFDVAVYRKDSGKRHVRAELGFLRRTVNLITSKGVCLIQANDPYLSGFNAYLLSRLTRTPFVVEVVANYDLFYQVAGKRPMPFLPSRAWEKRVERMVFRNAHAVYADRDFYLKYALANGARRDRARRVRCIITPPRRCGRCPPTSIRRGARRCCTSAG
jgi:hypothetical protein